MALAFCAGPRYVVGTCHLSHGQSRPFPFLCLTWMRPFGLDAYTTVPHFGHRCWCVRRATIPLPTMNCFPHWLRWLILPVCTLLWQRWRQNGHVYSCMGVGALFSALLFSSSPLPTSDETCLVLHLSRPCSQQLLVSCRPTPGRAVCVWPVRRRVCDTVHQCRFLTGHPILWQWLLMAWQVLLRYSSVFRCEAVFVHMRLGNLFFKAHPSLKSTGFILVASEV